MVSYPLSLYTTQENRVQTKELGNPANAELQEPIVCTCTCTLMVLVVQGSRRISYYILFIQPIQSYSSLFVHGAAYVHTVARLTLYLCSRCRHHQLFFYIGRSNGSIRMDTEKSVLKIRSPSLYQSVPDSFCSIPCAAPPASARLTCFQGGPLL